MSLLQPCPPEALHLKTVLMTVTRTLQSGAGHYTDKCRDHFIFIIFLALVLAMVVILGVCSLVSFSELGLGSC